MTTALLYAATVLIWGASWIGIAFQIAEVAPIQAVLYRFSGAAALIFLWLALSGRLKPIPRRAHLICAATGLAIFAANYVLCYQAIALGLTSGVAAVIYSLLVVWNAANAALIYGDRPGPGFARSAALGLVGIGCLFWEDLLAVAEGREAPVALLLCVGAVYCASLGNMGSRKLSSLGVEVLTANGWAMGYASSALFLWCLAFERPFGFSLSAGFLVSFALLTVFSTVVAFWLYFTLIKRIGAARAAYAFVAFPAVALAISSVFEGYEWTPAHLAGVALIAIGNVSLLRGARTAR